MRIAKFTYLVILLSFIFKSTLGNSQSEKVAQLLSEQNAEQAIAIVDSVLAIQMRIGMHQHLHRYMVIPGAWCSGRLHDIERIDPR